MRASSVRIAPHCTVGRAGWWSTLFEVVCEEKETLPLCFLHGARITSMVQCGAMGNKDDRLPHRIGSM